MDIRVQVLKKISPTKQDEQKARAFVDELMRVSKTISGLDVDVCGSIGKLTWLKGGHDIDLFMLFPHVSRAQLEEKGLEYGKKIVKELGGTPVIKYAEHPYVHAGIKGYDVDLVPCYRIKKGEKIKSAVDRSPLHLEYVLEKLNPGLRSDVRLLKQFMKGIGVYGSDAKHLGFSGYICELLVINYGTFESVLKAIGKWDVPQVICIEPCRAINSKKEYLNQPLIIIDPVDEKRNASAVVSAENFYRLIAAAKNYIKSPSISFFTREKKALTAAQIKNLENRGTNFVAVIFKKPELIDDVLYPQVRRLLKRMETLLRHNEFTCMRAYEHIENDIFLIFEFEVWSLPPVKKMTGPCIFSKQHAREFRKKYSNASLDGMAWFAEKQREHETALSLLKAFAAKAGAEEGVPKSLMEEFKKSRIVEGREFWEMLRKSPGLSAFLNEKYFSG